MVTKKKVNKWINIGYWGLMSLLALKNMLIPKEGNTNIIVEFEQLFANAPELTEYEYFLALINFGGIILFLFALFIFISMFQCFYLTIFYFGSKLARKKFDREKISDIDKNNKNYYRDILPNYSPAVLSYIDDFKIDESDVVATLLSLEMKGKIKIENNSISIIEQDVSMLSKNEIYIFDAIKTDELSRLNLYGFEEAIVSDSIDNDLLTRKELKASMVKKEIIKSVITYVIIILFFSKGFDLFNMILEKFGEILVIPMIILSLVALFLVVAYPVIAITKIIKYIRLNVSEPFIRNKKANELNERLEGLKKYIKDYSNMNERQKEEMALWEDYLIYSVIFKDNTKIVEDVMNIIKGE